MSDCDTQTAVLSCFLFTTVYRSQCLLYVFDYSIDFAVIFTCSGDDIDDTVEKYLKHAPLSAVLAVKTVLHVYCISPHFITVFFSHGLFGLYFSVVQEDDRLYVQKGFFFFRMHNRSP